VLVDGAPVDDLRRHGRYDASPGDTDLRLDIDPGIAQLAKSPRMTLEQSAVWVSRSWGWVTAFACACARIVR
jgi:hypothetical protein